MKKQSLLMLPTLCSSLIVTSCKNNEPSVLADIIVYGDRVYTASSANPEAFAVLIEEGKFADFVFADENLFDVDANDIWKINVSSTFFEGKNVYTK